MMTTSMRIAALGLAFDGVRRGPPAHHLSRRGGECGGGGGGDGRELGRRVSTGGKRWAWLVSGVAGVHPKGNQGSGWVHPARYASGRAGGRGATNEGGFCVLRGLLELRPCVFDRLFACWLLEVLRPATS
jgi:hypothetical protein